MVPRKLPSELEEEILIRVPPLSLTRFRTVCKEWNTRFSDKRFVNKNFAFARPEFMLRTCSNRTYSISVNLNDDPTIKVHDLTIDDLPRLDLANCDGYFVLFDSMKGCMVWNPLLRHSKRIQAKTFRICGMGYVSSRLEKSYKIVGFTYGLNHLMRFAMFEFETNAWKFIDDIHYDAIYKNQSLHYNKVSLNGNLYWTAYNPQTGQYLIQIFDFSKEIVKPFCILPCKKKVPSNTLVLAVYKGDRFSLLEQCMRTRNIEIWVTKRKISNGDDGDIVVWVKFMTVSKPNFPTFDHWYSSYLVDSNIYGKSFVMCCSEEETEKACVYIVREDLCKKIEIDHVFGPILFSVYVPSLILIS